MMVTGMVGGKERWRRGNGGQIRAGETDGTVR